MGLFSKAQVDQITAIAKKSITNQPVKSVKKVSSINDELQSMSLAVQEYFSDSDALNITDKDALHEYITQAIESGFVGIDTETTGLDRNSDYIVGASLYYPGGVEVYIPFKHRIPIFEDLYKNQLTYEDFAEELERFVEAKTKMIFANGNFDLYMIWKDIKINLCPCFYYDVILAWRCLKENELHNGLKYLYNKYVLKGKGDPKAFSDFFSPALFPYCKPEIAKLYAANDAKITYELFIWQVKFLMPNHKACQSHNLESISRLVWDVEFPIVTVCQDIEHTGMYIDIDRASMLKDKYHSIYDSEMVKLKDMVKDVINNSPMSTSTKPPFKTAYDFNPRSTLHVKYLIYTLMKLPKADGKESTSMGTLSEFNNPLTDQIIKVRSLATNISTFVDKLPNATSSDGKIHADFKQVGAATGRLSSANPNLMNIPSKLGDIRQMFRADPRKLIRVNGNKEYDNTIEFAVPKFSKLEVSYGVKTPIKNVEIGSEILINSHLGKVRANVVNLCENGDSIELKVTLVEG